MRSARGLKASLVVVFLGISYIFLYHVPNGTFYHRFPAMFATFVQFWIQDIPSNDVLSIFPMFDSQPTPDQTLPQSGQYMIESLSKFPHVLAYHVTLVRVTGLTPKQAMVMPLGIFVVPILLLAIHRRLPMSVSGIPLHYILFSYLLIFLLHEKITRGHYVGTLGFIVFLVVLWAVLRTVMSGRNTPVSGIFFIGMGTVSLLWYTMATRTIAYVGGTLVTLFILTLVLSNITETRQPVVDNLRNRIRPIAIFTLTAGVMYPLFSNLWGESYVRDVLTSGLGLIAVLLSNLINKLLGGTKFPLPYKYNYRATFWGDVYFYTKLAILGICAILVFLAIYYTGQKLYRVYVGEENVSERMVISAALLLAVGIAQLVFSILYSLNSIGFWFIPLFIPLFGIYFLTSFERPALRKTAAVFACVLLICATVLTSAHFLTLGYGYFSKTSQDDIQSSHQFMNQYYNDEDLVIADFSKFGPYQYEDSKDGELDIEYHRLDYQEYGALVGDRSLPAEHRGTSYAIVDEKTMSHGLPVHGYRYKILLVPKPQEIRNNPNTTRIYADGDFSIHKFSNETTEST